VPVTIEFDDDAFTPDFPVLRPAGERQDLALMHLWACEIARIAEQVALGRDEAPARPFSEAQLRQALAIHLREMRVLAPLLAKVIDAGQDDRALEDYEPPE
jgi:hypothetical protein